MARDYQDVYDLEDMDDDGLRELIVQKLSEYPEIDPDELDIDVQDGHVRVEGRVGTEEEVQEIDQVLHDVLGISDYQNDVIVDEARRAEYSAAADDAAAEDRETEDELGESGTRTESTAEHLMPDPEGELYGTHDVQRAIERGEAYSPPDRPPQLGTRSRENH